VFRQAICFSSGDAWGVAVRLSPLKGFVAMSAVALLVLLASGVPVANATPSLTCSGSNPGANGVLNVAVSSSGDTDSLTISESSGDYSLTVSSGGPPTAVCTGTTYPDSGNNGFPIVEVTGSALLASDFQASSGDAGLTFEGQAGATNTLDLGSLPNTGVTVSVPEQKVTWSAGNDLFSGISIVKGSSGGNTDFLTGNAGGYELDGTGDDNTLDLSGAAANVAASMAAGTVTGLQGSGPTSGVDAFSGIASFIGSTSGSTTVVADSGDGLSFVGKGSGNVLDLSNVPASQPTPLQVNVSGAPVNSLADNSAAVGSTTFSFSNVTAFAGSSDGHTTFFAGSSGGFTFNAAGGTGGNVLDLGAANSGLNVQVPTGTVSQLTTGTDDFSHIQTFNGPGGGKSIFAGGSPDNEAFNLPGNGNTFYGANGSVSVNATGNGNDFVAGSGNETFSDSGSANTLDFYEAAASQVNPLVVNLSGTQVGSVANNTASNGSATYSFGGIKKFAGANNGSTDFIASGTTGGYTFDSNGGNDTLDLSSWSFYAPGTEVSVPNGLVQQGASLVDFFVGIETFDGPASGNTSFTLGSDSGYTFNGAGSQNVLDMTNAGSGVTASATNGTVTLASGLDKYSGISGFVGSSAGDTGLDFSGVAASAGTPLKVNVSGATAGGIPDESAAVGGTTFVFENIATFTGSSNGHTAFFAGATGGFTFNGGGTAGNALDLSAANSGLFVRVPFHQVAGLTTGTDSFFGIQTFVGPAAGHATFLGGDTSGLTFDGLGNGNLFGPGGGSATFDGGSGSGNELDFAGVSTTTQAKLVVNLSGSTVGSTPNDTATVGASTYAFSGIAEFAGANTGNTSFIPSGSAGGFTFDFAGSGNTLDASTFPGSGTTFSVPHEALSGSSFQDVFTAGLNSFVTLVGSSAGNTDFVAGANGGYGFTGNGPGNVLDLTSTGSNVTASVPSGTISLGSGTDLFSGISSFIGSSSGGTTVVAGSSGGLSFTGKGSDNALSFVHVTTSQVQPLEVNLSGATVDSLANDTAATGSTTFTFSGVQTFVGSSGGNNTFDAGGTGGFTFDGGGSAGNALDLGAAGSGVSVSVPDGTVSLASGSDTFSGITTFKGSSSGGNTFVADASGGFTFDGGGSGNVLNLDAVASGTKVNVNGQTPADSGTVTGLAGGGTDSFSDIQSFTGPVTVYFGLTVAKSGNGAGTVTSSPAGISCGTACSHSFASGTSVTLSATAAAGSRFTGWSGACAGSGTCTVTMGATRSVTANFTLLSGFTLSVAKSGNGSGTVASSPAGIACGSTCSHAFTDGTSVTLTAHAATGSTFEGWSGACTGKAVCAVAMTAAHSVTASFLEDCVVPKVEGKSLSAAKRTIEAHGCGVGKVSRAYSKTLKKGYVISQKPSHGRKLAPGTKVSVVLSKGKRPPR
jgi:PASTA domain-containing protein/List-Bact-rpt repeat protein